MRTIKYTVSYEKLISRLPAMFAYIETDEQGVTRILKATNGEQGNYGKIVADLVCPYDFYYETTDGITLKVTANETHSYRKLIDIYYKAINNVKWPRKENGDYENDFLCFIERGIGLKYVGLSEENSDEKMCGVKLKNKFPLAPNYVYLGEAHTFYSKMIKMKKQLEILESHTKMCGEDKYYYLRLKKEYEMMNGEKLITKLSELVKEAEDVAEEYLVYANGGMPKLNFNVNLTTTIKDLGIVTPYIQEWEPGKRYYHGDVVYYVDENGYGLAWECDIKDKDADIVYYDKEKEEYKQNHPDEKDKTYVFLDEYNRKYINGQYDEETELIYFENGKQDVHDGKEARNYWKPQFINWVETNKNSIQQTSISNGFNSKDGTTKIYGTCNSHLATFRKYEEYFDGYNQSQTPNNFKDWLWYYRVGSINNRESVNDDIGNIGVLYGDENEDGSKIYIRGVEPIYSIEEDSPMEGMEGGEGDADKVIYGKNIVFDNGNAINLALWGDVLTDITAKNNYKTNIGKITFTYWLGVHLKAEKGEIIRVKQDDEIDNTIYVYDKKFEKGGYIEDEYKQYVLGENIKFEAASPFSINVKEYKYNDILTKYEYDNLREDNKGKVKYVVNNSFKFGETKYKVGDTIEKSVYDILDMKQYNINFVAKETFEDGMKDFDINDSVDEYSFWLLFNSFYDKLLFVVSEPFVFNGIEYKKDMQIKKTLYDSLGYYKKNIQFIAKESFTEEGKTFNQYDEIKKEIYNDIISSFYQKVNIIANDVILVGKTHKEGGTIDDYNDFTKLSSTNKDNVSIVVRNSFYDGGQDYRSGDNVLKEDYFKFDAQSKDNVSFVVTEKFDLDGKTYKVNDVFDKTLYNNNFSFVVNEEFDGYMINDYITSDDYDSLAYEKKEMVNIVCKRYILFDGKPYYKGDCFPNKDFYQTKIRFIANKDFNVRGRYFKQDEIISEDDYLSLDESNKTNVEFYINKNFSEETHMYMPNEYLTSEIYDSLSEDDRGKCEKDNKWYGENDDGVIKYYFKNPTIDIDSKYGVNKGVKYTETYIYYKSDDDDSIWKLVEDNEFEDYINGKFDKDSKTITDISQYKTRNKYEFDTSSNVYVYDIKVGNVIKEVPYIRSNFETKIDITHVDVEKTPLIHYDYYNGVSFQPSVNTDVNIERGVTQAYEKFIKFSEIKTFEDLENYANGGFFIFSKEDIDLG